MTLRHTFAALLATALAIVGVVAASTSVGAAPAPVGRSAPYEYLGWGNPQPPATVMATTGIRSFTLAFMLSRKTCDPAWDGSRPLTGGADQAAITSIRAAGGDVVVSFGGWSGRKLGQRCKNVPALAAAYQKVITAYGLKAIDIDIEHSEIANAKTRARVVAALATVRAANPSLEIYVTLGTAPTGPDPRGTKLIAYAASIGFMPTAWTVMPFDFGGGNTDMGAASVAALQSLNRTLRTAYGVNAATAYQHSGISSMNGVTDAHEVVSVASFQTMLAFAQQNHLARFTFWSVNRDRSCAVLNTVDDSCSGVNQTPYAFTNVVAQYQG
ncbi:MAG: chitinase [Acidimicrobiia bacterium]